MSLALSLRGDQNKVAAQCRSMRSRSRSLSMELPVSRSRRRSLSTEEPQTASANHRALRKTKTSVSPRTRAKRLKKQACSISWLDQQLLDYGCAMPVESQRDTHVIDACFQTSLPPLHLLSSITPLATSISSDSGRSSNSSGATDTHFSFNATETASNHADRPGATGSPRSCSSSSAASALSCEQILSNICALRTEYVLRLARPVLQRLMSHPQNLNIFNQPVDPVALGLPDYLDRIKRPMDLRTIRSQLRCRHYRQMSSFIADVELVFQNAMAYNAASTQVHRMARTLLLEFRNEIKAIADRCQKDMERRNEHSCSLCCGSLCYLCGEKCLKFDAPVLQCQAANCGQRIKKNALYYLTPDSSMLWCQKCYTALPQQIDLSAIVGPGGELDPDLDPELDPDLYNSSRGSSSGGGGVGGGVGGGGELSRNLSRGSSVARSESASVSLSSSSTSSAVAAFQSDGQPQTLQEGAEALATTIASRTAGVCTESTDNMSVFTNGCEVNMLSNPGGIDGDPGSGNGSVASYDMVRNGSVASYDMVRNGSVASSVGRGFAVVLKRQLLRRRADEEVAEAWVECDACGNWYHQVCALYVSLVDQAAEEAVEESSDADGREGRAPPPQQFHCPFCLVVLRGQGAAAPATPSPSTATSCCINDQSETAGVSIDGKCAVKQEASQGSLDGVEMEEYDVEGKIGAILLQRAKMHQHEQDAIRDGASNSGSLAALSSSLPSAQAVADSDAAHTDSDSDGQTLNQRTAYTDSGSDGQTPNQRTAYTDSDSDGQTLNQRIAYTDSDSDGQTLNQHTNLEQNVLTSCVRDSDSPEHMQVEAAEAEVGARAETGAGLRLGVGVIGACKVTFNPIVQHSGFDSLSDDEPDWNPAEEAAAGTAAMAVEETGCEMSCGDSSESSNDIDRANCRDDCDSTDKDSARCSDRTQKNYTPSLQVDSALAQERSASILQVQHQHGYRLTPAAASIAASYAEFYLKTHRVPHKLCDPAAGTGTPAESDVEFGASVSEVECSCQQVSRKTSISQGFTAPQSPQSTAVVLESPAHSAEKHCDSDHSNSKATPTVAESASMLDLATGMVRIHCDAAESAHDSWDAQQEVTPTIGQAPPDSTRTSASTLHCFSVTPAATPAGSSASPSESASVCSGGSSAKTAAKTLDGGDAEKCETSDAVAEVIQEESENAERKEMVVADDVDTVSRDGLRPLPTHPQLECLELRTGKRKDSTATEGRKGSEELAQGTNPAVAADTFSNAELCDISCGITATDTCCESLTSMPPPDASMDNAHDEDYGREGTNAVQSFKEVISPALRICGAASAPSIGHAAGWKYRAAALPRSAAGDFLEGLVQGLLRGNGFAAAAEEVTVRMVSNRDQQMDLPPPIARCLCAAHPNPQPHRKAGGGYALPFALGFRQKCFLLFQRIDGVDVCLFSLYVQEFDEQCPPPNTSTVYIAYLDSVEFFRPVEARSMVYQEMVAGYLQWAQARGFRQAHIWSCPPQRGDNFIFFAHPPYQRTPSRDRLNGWYRSILQRCAALGIVLDASNVWHRYFSQYMRRDAQGQLRAAVAKRSAAQNSFVGSGQVVRSKPKAKLKPRGTVTDIVKPQEQEPAASSQVLSTDASNGEGFVNINSDVKMEGKQDEAVGYHHQSSNMDSVGASEASPESLPVPLCPPVFEGDYWVLEFLRLHRLLVQKRRAEAERFVLAQTGKAAAARSSAASAQVAAVQSNARRCRDVLSALTRLDPAGTFARPVDPVAMDLPDYLQVVREPMDLGTVKQRLRSGHYANVLQFAQDVRLTFRNAMLFNPPEHGVYKSAQRLLGHAERALRALLHALRLPSDPGLGVAPTPSSSRHGSSGASVQDSESARLTAEEDAQLEALCLPTGTADKRKLEASAAFLLAQGDTERNAVPCAEPPPSSVLRAVSEDSSDSSKRRRLDPNNQHVDPSIAASTDEDDKKGSTNKETDADDDSDNDAVCSVNADEASRGTGSPRGGDGSRRDRDRSEVRRRRSDAGSVGSCSGGRDPYGFLEQLAAQADFSAQDLNRRSWDPTDPAPWPPVVSSGSSYSYSYSTAPETPPEPELSVEEVAVLFSDVGRGVQRLQEDLMVVTLAPRGTCLAGSKRAGEGDTSGEGATAGQVAAAGGTAAVLVSAPSRKAPRGSALRIRGASRHPSSNASSSFVGASALLPGGLGALPTPCIALLEQVLRLPATADPDAAVFSPLADSRHTFLEICQYRHLQFDSLRRAKHSSAVLLFILHSPLARCCRPLCSRCKMPMQELRWHCDQCPDLDLCNHCYSAHRNATASVGAGPNVNKSAQHSQHQSPSAPAVSDTGPEPMEGVAPEAEGGEAEGEGEEDGMMELPHPHPLTPFRVSFI